jgi:very-short-patch-repair endonuclease
MKRDWADPNSIHNSKKWRVKFRKALIGKKVSKEGCKSYSLRMKREFQNPNSVYNSKNWKSKQSQRMKGEDNPMKDKKNRKKMSKIMSKIQKRLWSNPKFRAKMIKKFKSKERRKKMSLKAKERFANPKNHPAWNKPKSKETKRKIGLKAKERWKDTKYRKKMSSAQKEVWENPEYKEKQVKRILSIHPPTKIEQRFDAFFKQNNLPFLYVGDGQVTFGGKCPDFICNPKKLVIEVGSKREKSFERKGRNWKGWKDYTRKRKAHFKRYFFDCIGLWEDDLRKNPQKILTRLGGYKSAK